MMLFIFRVLVTHIAHFQKWRSLICSLFKILPILFQISSKPRFHPKLLAYGAS